MTGMLHNIEIVDCLHSDRSFRVSDAFFVSVDKDHAKEIGRKLKRLAFPKFMPNI